MNVEPHHERPAHRVALPIAALFIVLPPILLAPAWRLWGLSALEDGLLYYLPQRLWFGARLAEGCWPLWQHAIYGGFPAFADPQMAMYYPPTWLFAVLPAQWAYPLSICLHHSLAAWLTYRLCRSLGRTRAAAILAGVAFAFCAFMLSHREHLTMHHAASWVPGVLWAWYRWSGTRRVAHWVLAVLMLAAQLMAGHVQVSLMTAPIVVAWLFWLGPSRKRVWLGCMAGFAAAAVICAVQVAPALQLLTHSAERREAYYVLYNSLLWRSLVLPVFPMLLGQRTPNFYPVEWFAPSHQCEQTLYVTLAVLALAAGAILLRWRQDRQVRFWAWTGLVTLVLALGRNAGVYCLLIWIPVFNVLHTPARWLLFVHVALIVIAAAGADVLLASRDRAVRFERVWRGWIPIGMAVAAALILIGFALADSTRVGPANPAVWVPLVLLVATTLVLFRLSRSPGRWGGVALIGLVVVDLATVAPFLDVSTAGVEAITDSPPARVLQDAGFDANTHRVWVIPGPDDDAYESPRQCLMPDTNLLDGLPALNGYGPMLPTELKALFAFRPFGVTAEAADWLARPGVLARLGVSHAIVRDETIGPAVLASGWALLATVDGGTRVYRNRHPSRLYDVTGQYRWCRDDAEAVEALRGGGQALTSDGEILLSGADDPGQTVGPGRILSAEVSGRTARFEVDSEAGTILIWVNRGYPGWHAAVDDVGATVYRADVIGQAVFVPAGRHRVVFEFSPVVLQWSAIVSLAGLLAALGLAVFGRRAGSVPGVL